MKVKELIKLIKNYPEAEVCVSVYTGCETPVLSIEKAKFIQKNGKLLNVSSPSNLTKKVVYLDEMKEQDGIGYNVYSVVSKHIIYLGVD